MSISGRSEEGQHMETSNRTPDLSSGIRINKYLSEAGVLSRRKADEAILQGEVLINGVPAETGTRVMPDDIVTWQGRRIETRQETRVFVYYKPIGQVCTSRDADKNSIFRFLSLPLSCMYVGRLDKDSQGLLLLTNDGDLSNRLQKAVNRHEKEYVVRVDKPVTGEFLRSMESGVKILDTTTRPCKVVRQGQNTFRIILTQGLNRQIRRMCDALSYRVVYLKRIRECNILLKDLKPGEYREVTGDELSELIRIAGT